MDTSKDTGSTRVNSKSSMLSSCQDLSEQSSPASSQILSNESRLSDISQATVQSINNNARITSGKKSDSSHISTPELSNRSQLSAKNQPQASDRSLTSVKGHSTSTSGKRGDVQNATPTETPERTPRSALRHSIPTEYADIKESLRKRKDVTPHRDSPRKPLRPKKLENVVPTLTSPDDAARPKRTKKKPESLRHSSQRNKGKSEEILKSEPNSETERYKLKKSNDDINEKRQSKSSLPSKLPIPCQNSNRQTQVTSEKPKHMIAESIKPTGRNSSKKVPDKLSNNADNIKPQPLKGKSSSFTKTGPVSNKLSMAKKSSDYKSKLSNSMARKQNQSLDIRTAKQAHQKTGNKPGAELDTAGQQEFVAAKDSDLDAAQIEAYFKLMDIYNKNERTIEDNQRKIDLQEKEMDELYPVVREEIDDMAGCTGEMARIRMIHKNFKDEASRVRVQHITNVIETDIYEEANYELKEHLSNLNQEITETKAINALNPDDVQTKAEMVWNQYNNQRQTNTSLEKEIQKLKSDLNAYMCGRASPPNVDNLVDVNSDMKSKPESLGNTRLSKDNRAGESKSADEVSFTQECQEDPREIKSDHQQEGRFKKILRSARGLLSDRKKKQADQKNMYTTDKLHLLEKKYHSDQNAESRCIEQIGRKGDVHLPPISTAPVHSRTNYTHKVSNFSLFSKQPAQYKRHPQNMLLSNENGPDMAVHAPHPPVSPRPENVRQWKLRTTRNLKN